MRPMILGLAASLLVATTASAHPKLLSANPAPKTVIIGSPTVIQLNFSEPVYPKLSGLVLKSATGAALATGKPLQDPKSKRSLMVPVTGKLSSGAYRVDWHAVSTDTHHVQGSFGFSVK